MNYYLRTNPAFLFSLSLLVFPLNQLNSEEPFCKTELQVGSDSRDCSGFNNSWVDGTIRVWVHIIDNDAGNGSQAVKQEEAILALNVLAADYEYHDQVLQSPLLL